MLEDKVDYIRREIARIASPPGTHEKPDGIGSVRFIVHCPRNSWEVLERAKEVLFTVDKASIEKGTWPSFHEWTFILPDVFVSSFATERSAKEDAEWLEHWQGLTSDEQGKEEERRQWTLSSWLYWMEPENRFWFWWDATEYGSEEIAVAVIVNEWPFPWGSLRWMFKACGADEIDAEE